MRRFDRRTWILLGAVLLAAAFAVETALTWTTSSAPFTGSAAPAIAPDGRGDPRGPRGPDEGPPRDVPPEEVGPGGDEPFSPAAVLRGRAAPREPRILRHGDVRVVPLSVARGWMETLYAHRRLWLNPEAPPAPEDEARVLQRTFDQADNGITRQNLIFLAALRLPPAVGEPWLKEVAASDDAEDAEDALVALAFSGEPDALAAFHRLAETPSPARVHRLVDRAWRLEELALGGEPGIRGVLRSYHALEVLDRFPYFMTTPYDVHMLGWTGHPRYSAALALDLEQAWLRRYPGHPGSDDVALRIARRYQSDGRLLDAGRWYLRSSTLPDQDVTHGAIDGLIRLCELRLPVADILRLIDDRDVGGFNRALLQYMFLRRVASEQGFERATVEVARIATAEPEGQIAAAWRRRSGQAPPKALDSGLSPLPPDDPLRRYDPTLGIRDDAFADAATAQQVGGAWPRYALLPSKDEPRLDPPDAVLAPHTARFARQFRLWETLAELERRTDRAKGVARADLLYQQAAVFYHEPRVLFPAYAQVSVYHRWLLGKGLVEDADPAARLTAQTRYETRSLSLLRALALFDRIERDFPSYPAMDRVVFSEAMAYRKLAEFRPFRAPPQTPEGWSKWSEKDRFHEVLRIAVATFERCARDFPESPLADDATRAAAYWRRVRPDAWK